MRWRARSAVAFLLVAALGLSAGCSSTAARPDQPLDDGRPLIVASGADLTTKGGTGIRAHLIQEWNAVPGHRKAKIVELPRAGDDQRSELVGALQSGTADYDVVNLDDTWIPEFVGSGLIRPLPGSMDDADFLQQAADADRLNGAAYAVPFNSDVGLLYYRTDGLNQAGITPDALHGFGSLGDLLHTIQPAGPKAYTTQLRAYEGLTVNTMESFWQAGVNLVDSSGRYVGTADDLRHGLAELARLKVGMFTTSQSLDDDETSSLAQFEQGNSVLMRGWSYAFNQLDAHLPPSQPFGVAPLPGDAALGGQSLAVTSTSAHPDDAQALITFLTSAASERELLAAGFAASRTSVYGMSGTDCAHDPQARHYDRPVRSTVEPSASAAGPTGASSARPGYTKVLWCALRQARARPRSAHYVTFTRVIQREVHRFLAGGATSEDDTARALQRELGTALGGR